VSIKTWGELEECDPRRLLKVKNFGRKSLIFVWDMLELRGFRIDLQKQ